MFGRLKSKYAQAIGLQTLLNQPLLKTNRHLNAAFLAKSNDLMSSNALLGLASYSDDDDDEEETTKGALVSYGDGDENVEELSSETKAKPSTKAILHKPELVRKMTPSATPIHSPVKSNISNLIRIQNSPTPTTITTTRISPASSPFHKLSLSTPPHRESMVSRESEDTMDLDEQEIEEERQRRIKHLLKPKSIEGKEEWGIPPEPEDECDPDLQAKIDQFQALRADGTHFNDHLYKSKAFRNPHIYAKLVEFVDLDEIGSNFPKEIFDPHAFPPEAYADELIEAQRRRAEERAAEQANRANIQFVTGSVSGSGYGIAPGTRQLGNPGVIRMRADAKDIVMSGMNSSAGASSSSSSGQAEVKKKRSSKWDVAAPSANISQMDYENKRRK